MNKHLAIFVFLLHVAFYTSAQTLTVSASQLAFGNAFENAPDSLQLTLTNNTGRDVTVTNIRFYDTYGVPAFSANSNWFIVNDNSSATIWIRFAPRHNIYHNSEMVIETDGLRGDISVDLTGQGKYSNHYYDLSENLSEENLKTMLGVITGNGYVSLGYNVARDSMFMSIDNKRINGQSAVQNTIECIYTGREAVGYTDRTDCQNTYSFNTEHTLPQSLFLSAEPMKSDLHHLFPTDDAANNQRADNPFGVVTNPTWSVGNSKSDGTTFEPRDEQKGVAARALFYFVLRYQNYNGFVTPQENILRTWFWNFPPDSIEKTRNENINLVQHNRNPFVDYPVFLERIHTITSNSSAPLISSIDLPVDTIVYGTVTTGMPARYNYVIVNNGNVPVNLSNFSLTHPGQLSFTPVANDTTLAPGEGLNIGITCLTSAPDSIHAFLTYNTNASGHLNVSVPIYVNDPIFNSVEEVQKKVDVFPNPAHDYLNVSLSHPGDMWSLYDYTGQFISQGNSSRINLENFSPGLYLLKSSNSHRFIVVQ